MTLREKYSEAITVAKNLHMEGTADERDGRLYVRGTVTSEAEKSAIWDALKKGPGWRREIVAEIRVQPKPGIEAPVTSMKTYTVQSGDTLARIAKDYLGNAEEYLRIYDANRDQLTDPDSLRPGQVLKLPAMTKQLK